MVVDLGSQQVYSLSLTEKQASRYLIFCDNNFEKFIGRLYI